MVSYKEIGLVNTKEMFAKAIKGGYAIPAFNFNNMEQLQAIIKAAAEKAGLKAGMAPSDVCDALVPVMTEITVDGLTGEGMTWSADGEPSKAPKAVKIKDGVYTAM